MTEPSGLDQVLWLWSHRNLSDEDGDKEGNVTGPNLFELKLTS